MAEEQNQNTNNIQEELERCQKEKEEYLNNWKRERADFINYKKDETKRMEEFLKFSTEGIIMELVDVIDGIKVARNNLPELEELKEWTEGFNGSLEGLDKFLKQFGVEKIDVKGRFDPFLHEAVITETHSTGTQNGEESIETERMEEIRPGYTMHGKVIRPARVKIIK